MPVGLGLLRRQAMQSLIDCFIAKPAGWLVCG